MRSSTVIRARVRKLLREAGIEGPDVPVDDLARRYQVRVEARLFQGNLDGLLVFDGEHWVIGVNERHVRARQRFTIAHELGHFFLHPSERLHIDRQFVVEFRGPKSSTGVDEKEIEANRFAAELLMPLEFLRVDLRDKKIDALEADELIEQLADRYDVSKQAMTIRLTSLGLGSALGIE